MATYTITSTPEAKRLLSPLFVGQHTNIPVRPIGNTNPYACKCVPGVVVSTDGYDATVTFDLPDGWHAV